MACLRALAGWLVVMAFPSVATSCAPAAIGVVLGGKGRCPNAQLVIAALQTSLPSTRVVLDLKVPDELPLVEIVDEGARYRVRAGNAARGFSDPERRCTERARAAAVFATLVLAPAALLTAPEPEPAPAPVPPPAPPPPPSFLARMLSGPLRVDLEGSGHLDWG